MPSATPAGSSGVRNVAGPKFFGSAAPAPFTMPLDRAGSLAPAAGRLGVELLAGLPESTLAGGATASAFV